VKYGNWLAFKYCQGTKQQTYTGKIAKTLPIILPPTVEEQNAITTALNETDEFIFSLERLIEKKQNIKKGAMQVLLTGKKRLKGFRDEWNAKKLSELLDYEQPVNYLVKNTEYNESTGIPVLTANKSFILGYTDESFGIFEKPPVIIFDDFTTASKYVTFPFKIKSSAIKILKPKNKEVDLRFVFEKIKRIQFAIGDHKRYYISEYQKIIMKVPSPDEQRAISKVICDMDSEIEALQSQLSKNKLMKQGMLQSLLTGKIRLTNN
jgi:type I restriction enzyme, S subunit